MINRLKILLTRYRLARWLVNLKNGTLRFLRHGYDPKRFWDEWSDRFVRQPYQRELHESNRWLLERLHEAPPTEVLEVGCGFGRNLKMLQDDSDLPCRLYGLDISLELLRRANGEFGLDVPLVCGNVMRLPIADGAFETVVTHGVLMHVPPEGVRDAIRELIRVTRRTLWCIEEQVRIPNPKGRSFSINDYTFAHDYPVLFREVGASITQVDYQGKAVALILLRVNAG
ncbi:MAG: class I SAM-dependent methyltransferase [Phycisphaerae bacterium]